MPYLLSGMETLNFFQAESKYGFEASILLVKIKATCILPGEIFIYLPHNGNFNKLKVIAYNKKENRKETDMMYPSE